MDNVIQVLITLPFTEKQIAGLRQISDRLHFTVYKAKKSEEIPAELWDQTEILYTSVVLPKTIEQAPRLRWIQFHWAGLDHVHNSPILRQPNLYITSASGANSTQVAEFAVMMILALGHQMHQFFELKKKIEWPADRWDRLNPRELRNSTVGIIGYGSIGRQIARLLQPFGCKVLACKRNAMKPEEHGYIPDDQGDPQAELVHRLYPGKATRSMVKECDFIVVCLPKTEETINFIGGDELAVMKNEAFLIDISRGGIVNHSALITALKEHKIAGAALDVFPEEPLPADDPLWKLPNVIISPHVAGISNQYDQRAIDLFAINLDRYLNQEPPINLFHPELGY
ncbi:MAG: D-2-hydroxyacid dehydrogenase [Anaerolineales bacterium]